MQTRLPSAMCLYANPAFIRDVLVCKPGFYTRCACMQTRLLSVMCLYAKKKKIHGSRETRLEAGFSASVGTPPPFKDQGADAAPKCKPGFYPRCACMQTRLLSAMCLYAHPAFIRDVLVCKPGFYPRCACMQTRLLSATLRYMCTCTDIAYRHSIQT